MLTNQRFYSLLAFFLSSVFLFGCGDSSGRETQNGDLVQYDIDLQISDLNSLSSEKRQVYEKLKKKEALSFSQITDLLIEEHMNDYNARLKAKASDEWSGDSMALDSADLEKKINEALKDVPASDFHQMKLKYEENLEENGQILYDKDAVSVADFVSQNRVQCYSGTAFHEIAARRLMGPFEFKRRNPVVIYEKGHVLPGYMTKRDDEWVMTGVETTTSGPSKVNYGKTKELTGAVRVVDAELFAIIEIFKADIENTDELRQQVLQMTAQKYDIPLTQTENLARAMTAVTSAAESGSEEGLNSSLFSFGQVEVPEVAVPRAHLEEKGASEPRGINGFVDIPTHSHLDLEGMRVIMDQRFELTNACGLKGHVEFEQLPPSAQASLTESLSALSQTDLASSVAQFFVQDCILFASFEAGAAGQDSPEVELPGPGMPVGKNAYSLTKEVQRFEKRNMLLQIFDLSLGEEILPLSLIGTQIYTEQEGDKRFVMMNIPMAATAGEQAEPSFDLSVFSMQERNIIRHFPSIDVVDLKTVEEFEDQMKNEVLAEDQAKLLNEPGIFVIPAGEVELQRLDLRRLELEKLRLKSEEG